jgi:2-oxoisovalerate dehydrogenase E1 component
MPGITVDGNDALAVFEAAGAAVRRARAGEGPTLLECKTYRTRPHAEGMRDGGYRSTEEVEEWKARDPIANLRKRLVAEHIAGEAELDRLDGETRGAIDEAFELARKSPWPDPATARRFVFSGE